MKGRGGLVRGAAQAFKLSKYTEAVATSPATYCSVAEASNVGRHMASKEQFFRP